MSACARLQQGLVSPSSLPEHGGREPSSGIDAERRSVTIAVNVIVSASIAVYRALGRFFDGESDGKSYAA